MQNGLAVCRIDATEKAGVLCIFSTLLFIDLFKSSLLIKKYYAYGHNQSAGVIECVIRKSARVKNGPCHKCFHVNAFHEPYLLFQQT